MMLLYVCAFTTGVQKGEAEGEGEGEGEEEGRRLAYTKGTYLVVRIWLHFSWTPKSEAPNLDLSSFFSPCFVRLYITDTSLISYRPIIGIEYRNAAFEDTEVHHHQSTLSVRTRLESVIHLSIHSYIDSSTN